MIDFTNLCLYNTQDHTSLVQSLAQEHHYTIINDLRASCEMGVNALPKLAFLNVFADWKLTDKQTKIHPRKETIFQSISIHN